MRLVATTGESLLNGCDGSLSEVTRSILTRRVEKHRDKGRIKLVQLLLDIQVPERFVDAHCRCVLFASEQEIVECAALSRFCDGGDSFQGDVFVGFTLLFLHRTVSKT
jgi:hypothetical protein